MRARAGSAPDDGARRRARGRGRFRRVPRFDTDHPADPHESAAQADSAGQRVRSATRRSRRHHGDPEGRAPRAAPRDADRATSEARSSHRVDGPGGYTLFGQSSGGIDTTYDQSYDGGAGVPQLTLDLQLVSPEDQKFDLFVHLDPDADRVECSNAYAKSDAPTGRLDELHVSWGDSWGSLDSRTVMLEVRSKSGQCSKKGTFSLVIQHWSSKIY